MNQKTVFGDFFGMRCVINEIIDISSSNEGEERIESETNLYYFDGYK